MAQLNASQVLSDVEQEFDKNVMPTLSDYIKIPNVSPAFDTQWATNGFMDKAVKLLADWVKAQNVPTLTVEVIRDEDKTPVILIECPATDASVPGIFIYGHMDKQPPFEGWSEGLGPYTPVIRDGKLYGRGGADDGYSIFSAVTVIKILKKQNVKHGQLVVLIEAGEESGSPDLAHYVQKLSKRIGSPGLIVCLDSGSGNYDQLWVTVSLRGMLAGDLKVEVLREGVHSGDASGIVPSSFRIMRQLLSRIEDEKTGEILLKALHFDVPAGRVQQSEKTMAVHQDKCWNHFPFVEGAKPMGSSNAERNLWRTWKPTLSVTGVDGIPPLATAGNVLRPSTTLRLSIRLPPRLPPDNAALQLKTELERDPPYGCKVAFNIKQKGAGWDAAAEAEWLLKAEEKASMALFGKPCLYGGEGGSIPFMNMLGERFPKAQFLVTGVLGPASNAHGPNESMDIVFTKKVTACVALIAAELAHHK